MRNVNASILSSFNHVHVFGNFDLGALQIMTQLIVVGVGNAQELKTAAC